MTRTGKNLPNENCVARITRLNLVYSNSKRPRMKKIFAVLFILITAKAFAQNTVNCSMLCIPSVSIDSSTGDMLVMLYNGDTTGINYPTIQVIDNSNGDTIGNPQGQYYLFMQGQGTTTHHIPCTVSTLPAGQLTILVTDQVWDTTCSFTYPMSCPMSVQEQEQHAQFEVYPNPATDYLTIALPMHYSGKAEVHITNTLGEVFCGDLSASNGKIQLSMKDLASGVYFITVFVGDKRYTQRMIRQ